MYVLDFLPELPPPAVVPRALDVCHPVELVQVLSEVLVELQFLADWTDHAGPAAGFGLMMDEKGHAFRLVLLAFWKRMCFVHGRSSFLPLSSPLTSIGPLSFCLSMTICCLPVPVNEELEMTAEDVALMGPITLGF